MMTLRPCCALTRGGPDGLDVYAEELDRLKDLGIRWLSVGVIRDAAGVDTGITIEFGKVMKPITILGFALSGGEAP